ncbi:MAG: acetate--CoA ligase family protein [Deltaproteobacteria bacterium]|nr:acetate--CoA ligase family protein [Deltaproteobacteria bacterium]
MEANELINRAMARGRMTLTEAEAKKLLSKYDVPVVDEVVVNNGEEAAVQAENIGFPVVLKGLGEKVTHKTELGLVRLNLGNEEEVKQAAAAIAESAGADLEGYLVQPMLSGRREFVAGLVRDPQFGPVVMFGWGGVFTEALRDVAFRIAPFDETEADRMLDEVRAAGLLGAFRGEALADRDAIIKALVGLSRLGTEFPEVAEIDVNPLLVGPDGRVTAVDALVALSRESQLTQRHFESEAVQTDKSFMDAMFHPKSIAVIGVPRTMEAGWLGLMGSIQAFGYPGRLYPINPKADEINGLKAYASLTDVPEPVDLVLVSVPAPLVPAALRDCVASGNKNVHIFSAGFKETGEAEGIRLQEEIEDIARKGGLRVIGPNCMGLYVPKARIVTWMSPSGESGPVAFISQSGGHAQDFTHYSSRFGIHFSKVISFGNALTLDSTDFLEYLGEDEETKIITMYLEGIQNGPKLLRQITELNRRKPVIVYKGGLTEFGARAVASHTGSLAGGEHIWDALYRQSGAVKVNSLEEMADMLLAFLHLPPARGHRVGILGTGGGIGVAATDTCARAGLEVPVLTEKTQKAFREFVPAAGNSIRNPVDAHPAISDLGNLEKALNILAGDPLVDVMILSIAIDWLFNVEEGGYVRKLAEYIAEQSRKHTSGKPLVVCWRRFRPDQGMEEVEHFFQKTLYDAGVPVYDNLSRAAITLSKFADYHRFINTGGR